MAVNDWDKPRILPAIRLFQQMGFKIMATRGTATYLYDKGITQVDPVLKVYEGRPNVVDHIKNDKICLVINTVSGRKTVILRFQRYTPSNTLKVYDVRQ